MKTVFLCIVAFSYKYILRKLFFLVDSETIHQQVTQRGEIVGKIAFVRAFLSFFCVNTNSAIKQNFFGIPFVSPIGLAAGFDYNAQLIQILPALGFGFATVGTITNMPYKGNPKPRLGRLIRSRSLMVNKGFKNEGVKALVEKLKKTPLVSPVGISIGRTNGKKNMQITCAIADIISAFSYVNESNLSFSYYELNISCPNLFGTVSFFSPKNLEALLTSLVRLPIKKPIFIKMPIEKTNQEIEAMLKVIVQFPIQGVIFGNLQKNKSDPAIDQNEVRKYAVGYFSGKPTEARSNELIRLTYQTYGKRLLIIGCGGVFSAQDAYTKITFGASLIQLITGLIYEGPQLIGKINQELPQLLANDGYTHISQAIGTHASVRS